MVPQRTRVTEAAPSGDLGLYGNGLLVGHRIENPAAVGLQVWKEHDPALGAAVLGRGGEGEGDTRLGPARDGLADGGAGEGEDDLAGGVLPRRRVGGSRRGGAVAAAAALRPQGCGLAHGSDCRDDHVRARAMIRTCVIWSTLADGVEVAGIAQAISRPRIVPVPEANEFSGIPMRCRIETNRLGSG